MKMLWVQSAAEMRSAPWRGPGEPTRRTGAFRGFWVEFIGEADLVEAAPDAEGCGLTRALKALMEGATMWRG
jgi:hypothetical protein